MFEIIPVQQCEVLGPDRELVPYDEAVFVDSEQYARDTPVRFELYFSGKKIGYARHNPKYASCGMSWSVRIYEKSTSDGSCVGFGLSIGKALEAACTLGVKELRDAANFASKMGTQVKRSPGRVSLGPAQEESR